MRPLRRDDRTAPRVSVVMVTYNAWDLTRQALAALVRNTGLPWELVVVDNASTDATVGWLGEGIATTVIRHQANLGFGAAANQGVAAARAPFVVLLNTDAFVHPGWLPPLLEVAQREPDVAVVGSRLVHVDGRLQDAGAIIWADGRISTYGDGADPDEPPYRFRRDVDYASGACVLMRRTAFLDAGGFDTVFAPAYYEDSDLQVLLRSAGRRCVYQPRSTATHVRWGSGSQEATAVLMERNGLVFRSRWRETLARGLHQPRHDAEYHNRVLAARDAATPERLLVVAGTVPGEATTEERALRALLRDVATLWPDVRVTLASATPVRWAAAEGLLAAGVEVLGGDDAAAVLRQRPGHASAVLVADSASLPSGAVAEAQPQAMVLHLEHTASGMRVRVAGGRRTAGRAVTVALADPEDRGAWHRSLVVLLSHLGAAPPAGLVPRTATVAGPSRARPARTVRTPRSSREAAAAPTVPPR